MNEQPPRRARCPVCDSPVLDEQAPPPRGLTVLHDSCWDRLLNEAGPRFLAVVIQRIQGGTR